jgi:hypothetical protein
MPLSEEPRMESATDKMAIMANASGGTFGAVAPYTL